MTEEQPAIFTEENIFRQAFPSVIQVGLQDLDGYRDESPKLSSTTPIKRMHTQQKNYRRKKSNALPPNSGQVNSMRQSRDLILNSGSFMVSSNERQSPSAINSNTSISIAGVRDNNVKLQHPSSSKASAANHNIFGTNAYA
jgi:hypothetical protein